MTNLERSAKKDTKGMVFTIILYAIGAVSVPFTWIADLISKGNQEMVWVCGGVCKLICAILPFYLIFQFGFKEELKFKNFTFVKFLLVLPAIIVALDNYPFVPVLMGDATLSVQLRPVIFYSLYCLGIGVLEESIFRGLILPLFLYKMKRNKKGVFLSVVYSSLIFGGLHLLNLFSGFSPMVFLQVGYSFLIGLMCSLVLLITENLWCSILVHTLFDFGGFFLESFGTGSLWTLTNIMVTAVVSVICAAILAFVFFKLNFDSIYETMGLNNQPEG